MELKDYRLMLKNKELISPCDIYFYDGKVNHILGKNGVGKSQFAIDLYLNSKKYDLTDQVTLISSLSNVPRDLKVKDLMKILEKNFDISKIKKMSSLLNIANIDKNLIIEKLSDGQKQKLKLLSFFCEDKNIIILDEITNALDKKTVIEIQKFINSYLIEFPTKTIINITHNLSDLKNIPGNYYFLNNRQIERYSSAEEIITEYVEGD